MESLQQSLKNSIVGSDQGLAVYWVGEGLPLLLFPYPHGAMTEPMATSPLCLQLLELGYSVITFDPPGMFQSSVRPEMSLQEMLTAAERACDYFGITDAISVIGHSMGGFCALAYALKSPKRVKQLMVICGNTGFGSVKAQWFGNGIVNMPDFVKLTFYGFREIVGCGSLKNHKQLNNLLDINLFENPALFIPRKIDKDDSKKPSPIRNRWMNTMRHHKDVGELEALNVPVLVVYGIRDLLSSEAQNAQLLRRLPKSRGIQFSKSRHYPHIEEPEQFKAVLSDFLHDKWYSGIGSD